MPGSAKYAKHTKVKVMGSYELNKVGGCMSTMKWRLLVTWGCMIPLKGRLICYMGLYDYGEVEVYWLC